MCQITDYFHETQEAFTIYIVEQRFVVGQGYEYFQSYKNKENYIKNDIDIKARVKKILYWSQQHIPPLGDLIKSIFACTTASPAITIVDIVTALSKVFAVEKHQAVGPDVLDPIIIQEGKVSQKYLSQLISLHAESILQPTIIILLADNDFDRAKALVSKCPNGINVKMIRNSGESEIYKVINVGAEDIGQFIDLYAKQCFSTCSETKRDVLLSDDWSNNTIVHRFVPQILHFRSNLLEDNKSLELSRDISRTLELLTGLNDITSRDKLIKDCLICMLKLFKIYCVDQYTSDLNDAWKIAQDLNSEILQAHVLRYSNFNPDISQSDKKIMLENAISIFEKNNIYDHAIYSTNNLLINQFYTDNIILKDFCIMHENAKYNVPGLVGMSYIYNNVGVAHLYCANYDEALEYLSNGLQYARYRPLQKLALKTNIIITKACNLNYIEENEIQRIIKDTFSQFGTQKASFLTANYVINALIAAIHINISFAKELLHIYKIEALLQNALSGRQFGTGSLSQQIILIQNKHPNLFSHNFILPSERTNISGIRFRFIQNNIFNPTIFNAWL